MRRPPYRKVDVLWNDAYSPLPTDTFEADDLGAIDKSLKVVTTGWLLEENDRRLIVAGEWLMGRSFRSLTVIPTEMVVEIHPAPKKKKATPHGVALPAGVETP